MFASLSGAKKYNIGQNAIASNLKIQQHAYIQNI